MATFNKHELQVAMAGVSALIAAAQSGLDKKRVSMKDRETLENRIADLKDIRDKFQCAALDAPHVIFHKQVL